MLELSSLPPEAGWGSADYVQVVPAQLSTEDMMWTWDALEPSYRLGVSYLGRVVQIDNPTEPDTRCPRGHPIHLRRAGAPRMIAESLDRRVLAAVVFVDGITGAVVEAPVWKDRKGPRVASRG